jgi:hypothetical protein
MSFISVLTLPEGVSVNERLAKSGLYLMESDLGIEVDRVDIGSPAAQAGLDAFQQITNVEVATSQPPKQLIYIPALLLILLVAWMQKRHIREKVPTSKAQKA